MGSEAKDDAFARACNLLAAAREVVAFTGAGISAESGIPTYRDAEEGLWSKYDPQKFASIDYFLQDSTLFWRFFQEVRYPVITGARPNPGHQALAALERLGRLRAVITQNIDGLHQAAGSQEVIELHGNTRAIRCLQCGARYSMESVYLQLARELPPPCRACGGLLKPDVVFFGEALPEQAQQRAAEETEACDLMLAIGSSLVVYPAALLPERACRRGAGVVIINRTPTPLDERAGAVLRRPAGEVLPQLVEATGLDREPA